MSQENVEMVRRIFEAFNRRDIDAVVESATADFVAIGGRQCSATRGQPSPVGLDVGSSQPMAMMEVANRG